MKITSHKLNASNLTSNEEALLRCTKALELRDKGDFDRAQHVMRRLWRDIGTRPDTKELDPSVAAEVLLCVGILTRWLGSRNALKEADGIARDLITESITYYQSVGDLKKVAQAQSELAYCYWRGGSFNEARIMFTEALERLTTEGNTRANALLGLSVVEWSSSRYDESRKILTQNALLFKKITNHNLKGSYHNQLAMVLRTFVTPEKKAQQLRQVVSEYEEADRQFTLARNTILRAMAKANLANVLRELRRFKDAHEYLDHARRLAVRARDRVRVAQVDQTRAEVMIDQGRFNEAERVLRLAAKSFERSGRQCLLVDALIKRGIALARLHRTQEAQFTFQKAIEVANQVDAPNKAGLAALALIEELNDLSPQTLGAAYKLANESLADTQSPDLLHRINTAATKVFAKVQDQLATENPRDVLANKPLDFAQELLRNENALIKNALAKVNGSLTQAASSLKMSYQKLAYIIETRHRDLITERSPVRRRAKSLTRSQLSQ